MRQGNSTPLANRVAGLSPARQQLLERRLGLKREPAAAGLRSIPRLDTSGPLQLSFAQEQVWLLDQLLTDKSANNVPRLLRVNGSLNVRALEAALHSLVGRHEVLRTTYSAQSGRPEGRISSTWSIALPIQDLSGMPTDEREKHLQLAIEETTRHPFDLSREILLRAALVRLADDEHVLVLVTHHIASDGWSRNILYRELSALYAACREGRPSGLSELPIQYADYAAWQRAWLQGDALESRLGYWKKQLAGAPTLLELPTDRPRPAVSSFRGATRYVTYPRPLLEGLRKLSQREGVTLFMTLQAAFQALLNRYTGQDDLVIGSAVSGRAQVETEGLIGDFVNMLVLRTNLAGNPSFRELLQRVRQVVLEGHEHGDLPFAKLVAELQPTRTLSYSPLFQVVFALENSARDAPQFTGLKTEALELSATSTKQDLILTVIDESNGLKAALEYSTELFDEETIVRMLGHLRCILESIVADPGRTLRDLAILSDPEKHQLVSAWNETNVRFGGDSCVHKLFELQAKGSGDSVAVGFEKDWLTYAELNARSNQLAHHLQQHGVGPESLVGICVDRSPKMLVGLLGILKAGGAYVPLDPALPMARLTAILEDARPRVLVTERKLLEKLPALPEQTIRLDADWPVIAGQCRENPETRVQPENLAYVLFTSGSTGRPKGVQVSHGSVANILQFMGRKLDLTQRDVMPAVTTLSFDIAALELFLPLTVGARVVIPGREVTSDGVQLAACLAASSATIVQATPATWHMLIRAGWKGDTKLKVLCGGEALDQQLASQLLQRCASLWNVYGPTETTIWSTLCRIHSAEGPIAVGEPIANTRIQLLDRHGNLLPIGVPGEICIGGAGVARGYLNQPELTAEKFIPDRFNPETGARIYRTGDRGRIRPDGVLECMGRYDHQVKVRGHRIELGEIETALRQHPSVRDAIALARDDAQLEKILVAYVVTMPGHSPTSRELRAFLQSRLPEYMMPSAFVALEALPLTPAGKVDRAALPAPETSVLGPEESFVAPATPVEETLAQIWSEALGVPRVSAQANFFELGGHSLLATQVVARIRDSLQVELPMRLLFEVRTLAELGQAVEQVLLQDTDPTEMDRLLAELEDASGE
jgi:amino acid adenylation domain-containing protein